MNIAAFAIVWLLAASSGQAGSALNQSAGDSKVSPSISGYELLADGSIHKGRLSLHSGFFVQGQIRAGLFVPRGNVRGEGALGTAGQSGWIELSNGTFYGDETARTPNPPYVRGFKECSGKFLPSSRNVVY